jgi:hypothetical protein
MKMIDRAPIVFVFIATYLYVTSTAHTLGYFHVLSLDSDLLDRTFHQVLYHGLIINLEFMLFTMLSMIVVAGTIILLRALYQNMISKRLTGNFSKAKSLVKSLRKYNLISKSKKKHEKDKYEKGFEVIGIVTFLFIMSVIILAGFESKGAENANKALEYAKNGTISKINLESQKLGKDLGFLYCGSRNCAALNLTDNSIVYFPQNGHIYSRSASVDE